MESMGMAGHLKLHESKKADLQANTGKTAFF